MLDQIKLFFDRHLALAAPDQTSEEQLHVACAALLIEVMYMDDKIQTVERDSIIKRLKELFPLSLEELEALISLAEQQRAQATDYFQFTHLINKEFTADQKIKLIESLWQVAYADGNLDEYEEYMVRKVADLIYVPHTAFIMAKQRVKSTIS